MKHQIGCDLYTVVQGLQNYYSNPNPNPYTVVQGLQNYYSSYCPNAWAEQQLKMLSHYIIKYDSAELMWGKGHSAFYMQ